MEYFISAQNYYSYAFCEDVFEAESDDFNVPQNLEGAVNYFLKVVKNGYDIDYSGLTRWIKSCLTKEDIDDAKENGCFGTKLILYIRPDDDCGASPLIENVQSYDLDNDVIMNDKYVDFAIGSVFEEEYKAIMYLVDKHNHDINQ